jgi:membrane-associated phospholipid phosphatase
MVQRKQKGLKKFIEIEKKPRKGLLPLEWVVLAYLFVTLLIVLFTYTKIENPQAMIWGRVHIGAITVAMWGIYRLIPCRLTKFARVAVQAAFLPWWYPETYEINRIFPNLDHIFAQLEQSVFGFQPALVFAQNYPSPIISELMDMGYALYFPIIAMTLIYYFLYRYEEFTRMAYVVVGSFFIFYIIYDLLPVTGPMFYYKAVGVDKIAQGIFPNVGDYFLTHRDMLTSPGYQDGVFYHLVEAAHNAGERPTAAFPSSPVGVSTICMLAIAHARNWKLLAFTGIIYVFLCMATVYIQAHYVIDAIAGFFSGIIIYAIMMRTSRKFA